MEVHSSIRTNKCTSNIHYAHKKDATFNLLLFISHDITRSSTYLFHKIECRQISPYCTFPYFTNIILIATTPNTSNSSVIGLLNNKRKIYLKIILYEIYILYIYIYHCQTRQFLQYHITMQANTD